MIGVDGIRALDTWVKDHGGIVVFDDSADMAKQAKSFFGKE